MERYDISNEAKEDLYSIWTYTVETWSEEQADKYYGILVNAFETIASSPLTIGREYNEIIDGLRAFHVGRHLVFYVIQTRGRVLIARILHERMDYLRHFIPPSTPR